MIEEAYVSFETAKLLKEKGLVEIQKVVDWIKANVVAYNPSKKKMECIVNINNMLEDLKINN